MEKYIQINYDKSGNVYCVTELVYDAEEELTEIEGWEWVDATVVGEIFYNWMHDGNSRTEEKCKEMIKEWWEKLDNEESIEVW